VSGTPQVMLLCGADLVESFATPGVWKRGHLQQIMGPGHGVVCIAR
jgi:nicotinamide mononucleotide adenylyltransferase